MLTFSCHPRPPSSVVMPNYGRRLAAGIHEAMNEQDLIYRPLVDSSGYRQQLIDAKLLRPRAVVAEGPTRQTTHCEGVLKLDDAGRVAAAKHLQQGREGRVNHSVFVPSHVWQGARHG